MERVPKSHREELRNELVQETIDAHNSKTVTEKQKLKASYRNEISWQGFDLNRISENNS